MHPPTNISAYVGPHAALIKLAVTIFIEACFDTQKHIASQGKARRRLPDSAASYENTSAQ
jgi:hypothetical protein